MLFPVHLWRDHNKTKVEEYRRKFSIPDDEDLFAGLGKRIIKANERRTGNARPKIKHERKYSLLFNKDYFKLLRFLYQGGESVLETTLNFSFDKREGGEGYFKVFKEGDIVPQCISKHCWKDGLRKKLLDLNIIYKEKKKKKEKERYSSSPYFIINKSVLVEYIEQAFHEYLWDEYIYPYMFKKKETRTALKLLASTRADKKFTFESFKKLAKEKESIRNITIKKAWVKIDTLLRTDDHIKDIVGPIDSITFRDVFEKMLLFEHEEFIEGKYANNCCLVHKKCEAKGRNCKKIMSIGEAAIVAASAKYVKENKKHLKIKDRLRS